MQITEKWQLPPFKLGVRADEEAEVEAGVENRNGPWDRPIQ